MEYWSVGSHKELFNPFNRFARFNRYAPFKPPPLSSPATRGRMKEGGLNSLNDLNCLNQKENYHSITPFFRYRGMIVLINSTISSRKRTYFSVEMSGYGMPSLGTRISWT
jgi:hypothetical protein